MDKGPEGAMAKRVLWPSSEYEFLLQDDWERTDYFRFITSVNLFETILVKKGEQNGV